MALPMPLPAPITAITWRASSFSGGIRRSFASSSSQYSMSNASCWAMASYSSIASAPAHHLDGAVVELGGHARLALVLAPGDHARARESGSPSGSDRASAANRAACTARSRPRSPGGTASSPSRQRRLQRVDVAGSPDPSPTNSGLILVRRKWSGQEVPSSASRGASWLFTKRSIRSSSCTVATNRRDAEMLAAQPGQDLGEDAQPLRFGERRVLLPAERLLAAVALLDVRGGAVDDLERRLVARLVVVAPVIMPWWPSSTPLRPRVLRDQASRSSGRCRSPGRCQGT